MNDIVEQIKSSTDPYFGYGHFHVSNMADYTLLSNTINDMLSVYDITEEEAMVIIQKLTHE